MADAGRPRPRLSRRRDWDPGVRPEPGVLGRPGADPAEEGAAAEGRTRSPRGQGRDAGTRGGGRPGDGGSDGG